MKIFLLIFLISFNTFAYEFKIRAREHFEIHELHTTERIDIYKGLTNTINVWLEKPYDSYFGLSFSPIIAGIKAVETDTYGEKITQQNIGFEYKFFSDSKEVYYRLGLGYSKLETTGGEIENYFGNYGYIGLGTEIPIKNFGLALELAYRYANYNEGLFIKTITPSIGFHFYKDL